MKYGSMEACPYCCATFDSRGAVYEHWETCEERLAAIAELEADDMLRPNPKILAWTKEADVEAERKAEAAIMALHKDAQKARHGIKWISVDDRLPPEKVTVLVWGNGPSTAERVDDEWMGVVNADWVYEMEFDCLARARDVTHWAEIEGPQT